MLTVLPDIRTTGAEQMSLDKALLQERRDFVARRYVWAPPALSLGRFQAAPAREALPIDVVRRPTGGRAVLHGEAFEWSFAVAMPNGATDRAARANLDITQPYALVVRAVGHALTNHGLTPSHGETASYCHAPYCFATVLAHDLTVAGEKVVALAQCRFGGRVLVHGSVLERRPPETLRVAAETVLGESWDGVGLDGRLSTARDSLWRDIVESLAQEVHADAST